MRAAKLLRSGEDIELSLPAEVSRPITAGPPIAAHASNALLASLRVASAPLASWRAPAAAAYAGDPARGEHAIDGAAAEHLPAASVPSSLAALKTHTPVVAEDGGDGSGDGGSGDGGSGGDGNTAAGVVHQEGGAAALSRAHAEHAEQLSALVAAVGGNSSKGGTGLAGAPAADASSAELSASSARLDGVLATLQRCRSTLVTQAPLCDEEALQAELEALIANRRDYPKRRPAFGSGSAVEEDAEEVEEGEEMAGAELLAASFPAHISVLFGSESKELREMGLDRLASHVLTAATAAAADGDDPDAEGSAMALHVAAAEAEAEAAILAAGSVAGQAPPVFWARAGAAPAAADEEAVPVSDWHGAAEHELEEEEEAQPAPPCVSPEEQLRAVIFALRECLADPEPRVVLAALAFLAPEGPLVSALLPNCSLAAGRRLLPQLVPPLGDLLGARSARIAQGAMDTLHQLVTHTSTHASAALLPRLLSSLFSPAQGPNTNASSTDNGTLSRGSSSSSSRADGAASGGGCGRGEPEALVMRLQLLLRLMTPPAASTAGGGGGGGNYSTSRSAALPLLDPSEVLAACAAPMRHEAPSVRMAAVELLVHAHAYDRAGVEAWLSLQPPLPPELHDDLLGRIEQAGRKILHPPPTASARPSTASRPTTALLSRPSTAAAVHASLANTLSRPSTAVLRERQGGAEEPEGGSCSLPYSLAAAPTVEPPSHEVQILRLD